MQENGWHCGCDVLGKVNAVPLSIRHTIDALRLPVGLVVALATALGGCSASSTAARAPARPDSISNGVEVWSDREPVREFVETGDLWARTASRKATIAKLQKQAARLYMSGVYEVDCKGPGSGECTATGFVYRETPGSAGAEVASR